jgi:maltooligosyltrehalose trehalohydrolase
MKVGAQYLGGNRCLFRVWAPLLKSVELSVISAGNRRIPMDKDGAGYWEATVLNAPPGTLYKYVLNGGIELPDPASRYQPEGVHGPSQVIDEAFPWTDWSWKGSPLREWIIYELHTGAFTPEGTLDAIIPRLSDLKRLGVNALELMPVAQFPGGRNWGYDVAYPYAVQNSYGGPEGLKRLVDAAHGIGMSVILDVVYNHFGPEGAYIGRYGPYFNPKYETLWGDAINFDGPYSDGVRNFYFENAVHWLRDFHIDALRLDAVHAMYDRSARPFLRELKTKVDDISCHDQRRYYLVAECDLNDPRIIRPRALGGYALDAQWCDDFHHALHTVVTCEHNGYYVDYGRFSQLMKSFREAYVYTGQYSELRKRSHGDSAKAIAPRKFVVFSQNHDHVGNRMLGERTASLVDLEGRKLLAGSVLLSPYLPLLFMGEEYGEDAPFLYFVEHSDPQLIKAVRDGRASEFRDFNWEGEVPDPQSEESFQKSKLAWKKRHSGNHKVLYDYYRDLISLRQNNPAIANSDKYSYDVSGFEDLKVLLLQRWRRQYRVGCMFCFSTESASFEIQLPAGKWKKILDSAGLNYGGPGALLPDEMAGRQNLLMPPRSLAVYEKL